MPERKTIKKAQADKRQGKAATTQAGEFVRDEMERIRHGEHGARSTRQAIAIGLSKARRAGVRLPPPKKGKTSADARRHAERDYKKGGSGNEKPSPARSRAFSGALRREDHSAASKTAISRQTRHSAGNRTGAERSAAARKAAGTR